MLPFVQTQKMATVINMARAYNCKPSEIVGLTDYAAYCFDEATFYLLANVPRDREGAPQWSRLRWADKQPQSNKEFMEFVRRQQQKGR